MRRLLNKYRERKSKEVARKKEWQAVNAERPNPDMDHPTDKKLIEEAQQTIGNYNLKTNMNFEACDELRDTIVKKLQELVKTRVDVYKIRNDYNRKIFSLRDKKKKLIEFIQRQLKKLEEIHLEVPKAHRFLPEIVVTFDFDREFPERNLDLKKYLMPDSYDSQLVVTSGTRTDSRAPRDLFEKQLTITQRSVLHDYATLSMDSFKSYKLSAKSMQRSATADNSFSDWEDELKNLRIRRRLFEQNQIIDKVNQRIAEFDEEIVTLCDDRYDVEVKAKFKELYLLTLNHELMILKDFESTEENLVDLVDGKDMERRNLANRIAQATGDIELLQTSIEELLEDKRRVEQKFKSSCLGNKFSPFLKKVFKKKFREGDEDDDAEKENSDASDSTNESPGGSAAEHEVGSRRMSDALGVKNWDQKLYDLTFELRREKHELEQAIKLKESDVESYQMEVDIMAHRMDTAEKEFEMNKTKLKELRYRKQQMLNGVNTVVCLKMDQMQYFKNQTEFENIGNTLLFNNQNVTKLYARVGKLALETIEAKRKHRINVIHLAKMKTDIKFMEKQIADLKDGTSQAMLKKFGRVIDLNEVEETILRRFAFELQVEMRANAEDIKRQYFNKINELKKTKIVKEETLSRVIQEATEKLNILTVLEEEKNFLHRIIAMQSRKREGRSAGYEIINDLGKLKEISNHQKEQIEMLQREIRALSLKTKSFVDARQEFESLNYSITQLRGECRFEDSICSNPDESMLSSTRATTPDHEVFNEILKTVKKFAEDNFREQVEEVEIENISLNLAKYLTNVAVNFPPTEADEILPEVINNFSNFLPKHIRVAPENVAELVAKIIGNYNESNEANRCEVLREIMNNTIESANQTAISSNSYLQHIVTEIFKQMVITMRFKDIANPDCGKEIAERLSKLNATQTRNVNIDEVIDEILEHANDNMEDDIDGDVLRKIISDIIGKLNV